MPFGFFSDEKNNHERHSHHQHQGHKADSSGYPGVYNPPYPPPPSNQPQQQQGPLPGPYYGGPPPNLYGAGQPPNFTQQYSGPHSPVNNSGGQFSSGNAPPQREYGDGPPAQQAYGGGPPAQNVYGGGPPAQHAYGGGPPPNQPPYLGGPPPYPYQPSGPNPPPQYTGFHTPETPAPPPPGQFIGGNPNFPQPPGSEHNPYGVPYQPNQHAMPPAPFQLQQSGNYQPPPPHQFTLSNCTGRKRALLIGINDVMNLKRFISHFYNFREEDMVILTEDQRDPTRHPTRANIISAMHWLVHDARPNDSYFLHYSGHGTEVPDLDGDEDDGFDEAICPVDYNQAGLIIDDEIHAICVAPLPAGVRMTAIFDSCHSGTAMDLPYVYSTTGELKTNQGIKKAGKSIAGAVPGLLMGNQMGALMAIGKTVMGAVQGRGAEEKTRATRTSAADVVMFSGCKDSQTSADANIAGVSTGAMSYAFRTALEKNQSQSYQQLLVSVRDILRTKYSQLPQLSSSHPMDMRLLFIM